MRTSPTLSLFRRVQQRVVKLVTTTLLIGFLPVVGGVVTGAVLAPQAKAATFSWSASISSPYTCSPNFYQVSAGKYYRFDPSTKVYTQLGTMNVSSLNALGYNPADNYIYGNTGSTLYKINSAGAFVTAPLSATAQTTGGDFIKPNVMITASQTGTWTSIDVLSGTVTTLTSSGTWGAYDLTIQNGNTAYGLNNGTLYKAVITPSGTTYTVAVTSTTLANSTAVDQDNYGAAYSDVSNNLYFFSNTQHNLWEITNAELQKANPTAVKITSAGTLSSPNDGASCSQAASPLDPPTPIYDSYTVIAGQPYTTTTDSLTANDQYISSSFRVDTITGINSSSVYSQPVHTINNETMTFTSAGFNGGAFTYTSSPTFSGVDTATYWLISTDTTPAVSKVSATINFNVVRITNSDTGTSESVKIGAIYSKQVTTGGNISGFTFTAANLPPGLSISPLGVISGTPTTAGTYYVVVTLSNGTLSTNYAYSITVSAASQTITYDTNGATSGTTPSAGTFAPTGTLASIGNVIKTGYTFQGWSETSTSGSTIYKAGDSYTATPAVTKLYAIWAPTVFTITYDPNGGTLTGANSDTFTVLNYPTLRSSSTVSRTGYTFNGWFAATSGGSALSSYTTPASTTVYAQWTATTYHLYYDPNGGATTPSPQTYTILSPAKVAGSITRNSDAFVAWKDLVSGASYNPNDSVTVSASTPINETLTAQFTTGTFISYAANGGSGSVSPTSTNTGGSVETTSALSRSGYTISGWNTQPNGSGKTYSPGDPVPSGTNLTLYAVWVPNIYLISYDANGGTGAPGSKQFTVVNGVTVDTTSALVRAGYTLNGWNTSNSGTGTSYQPGDLYQSANNLILYANWTPISYVVSYNGNGATGGTAPSSNTFNVSQLPINISDTGTLTYTNATFGGWNTAADGSGQTYNPGDHYSLLQSVTLYAVWIPIGQYVVTYNPNGGTGAPGDTKAYQGTKVAIASGSSLSRPGYNFAGWWNGTSGGVTSTYAPGDSYTVNADLSLTAVWVPIEYQITYDANGATSGTAPNSDTYTIDSGYTIKSPGNLARTGYAIQGWNKLANGTGSSYQVGDPFSDTTTVVLYANWIPVEYLVTYDPNGGSQSGIAPADETLTVLSPAVISDTGTITYAGEKFAGWNTDPLGHGASYNVGDKYSAASNLDLFAQWIPSDSYTVTYDANGGSGAPSPSVFSSNASVQISNADSNTVVRTGFIFNGWNTKSDGTGNSYGAGDTYKTNANLTLYAIWQPILYRLSYDANGGTGSVASQTFTVDSGTAVASLSALTRAGYTLAGWWTSDNTSTGKSYAPGDVFAEAHDQTLFAVWTPNIYEIAYDANGGTATTMPANQTYTVGGTAPVIADGNSSSYNLTNTGYTFNGWNTKSGGTGKTYNANDTYSDTSSAVLFAQWTPVGSYVVTYDMNGVRAIAPANGTFTDGDSVTIADTSTLTGIPAGYVFDSWNTQPDGRGTTYLQGQSYSTSADLNLYAIWVATEYTVSYDPNQGTGSAPTSSSFTVAHPATVKDNVSLVRTGYTFSGWNTSANGTGTTYAPNDHISSAGSVVLYAVWVPIEYQVTYDLNGADAGSVAPQDETFTLAGAAASIADTSSGVTKTGYTFVGWNTTQAGTGSTYQPLGSYHDAADLRLYAMWEANGSIAVTYDANGGNGAPQPETATGTSASFLIAAGPSRYGYHFAGWWTTLSGGGGSSYTANQTYTITGNTALYAQWVIDTYTVTYDVNGATTNTLSSTVDSFTVTSGYTIQPSGSVARTGYTFAGWNTQLDANGNAIGDQYQQNDPYAIAANLTIHAVWIPDNHTLSYDANGGYGTTPPDQPFTVASPAQVSGLGSIHRDWYAFTGWNTKSDGSGDTYTANSSFTQAIDQILYAQWTPRTYTITYHANGGTGSVGPDTVSATSNTLIETTTGFAQGSNTISYWNSAADGSGVNYYPGDPYIEAADLDLYAIWPSANHGGGGSVSPTLYRLAFNINGGIGGTPAAYSSPSGSSVTLPGASGFSNPGFTFGGWSTSPNGGGNIYAAGTTYTIGSSVNLYAIWIPVNSGKPSATPTPGATPTAPPAPTTEPGGVLTRTVEKKAVQPNQIVSIGEQIHLSIDPTSSVKEVLVNGKPVVTKENADGSLKLQNLVGPKDKVVVEVKQSDGTTAEVPVTESNSLIDLANVNFDLASAALTPSAKKILDNVAKVVLQHGFTKLDLAGHTDSLGSGTYDNQTLSHQRAVAVEVYLKSKLSTHHVSVKVEAKAEVDPIAANETAAGRAINRRVEIKVA